MSLKSSCLLVIALVACGGKPSLSPESADSGPTTYGTAGTPDAMCSNTPSSGTLPCDVAVVLADKCQTCHADPPLDNAPLSLTTYADTMASFPLVDGGSEPVWKVMAYVIQPDASPHMPYLTAPALTSDQVQTLQSWFTACAPSGSGTCESDAGTTDAGTTDAGTSPGAPTDAGSSSRADSGYGPGGGGPPPY